MSAHTCPTPGCGATFHKGARYSSGSSTFANGVGRLRTLELVEGWHLHPDFRASLEAEARS